MIAFGATDYFVRMLCTECEDDLMAKNDDPSFPFNYVRLQWQYWPSFRYVFLKTRDT